MRRILENLRYALLLVFTGAPFVAYGALKNPIKFDNIPALLAAVLDIVIKIGIPIAVLFIIYSGFLFVKAQGKDEKLKEAKVALGYTLLGTAILLGAWAISEVIQNTVNQFKS